MTIPRITELQKRKIKIMVDELIVNRGILAIGDRRAEIDGLDLNQLGNLAFKYYKMILFGESPLDIDAGSASIRKQHAPTKPASHACIGCGGPLPPADIEIRMPACQACRDKIRIDYDLLRELFL